MSTPRPRPHEIVPPAQAVPRHERSAAEDADISVAVPRLRRILVQVVGFAVGIGLVVWCVRRAASGGNWETILHASAWQISGLLGFTILSLVMAGTAFWVAIQPVRQLRWRELQGLNFVASLFNYAPVRLGLVTRVVWHLRVDRIAPLMVVGWFGSMGLVMGVVLGSAATATLVHPRLDAVWAGLLLVLLLTGGMLLRVMVQMPLARTITRRLHGMERLILDHRALWGGVAIRVLDLTAFTGRMACAASICGITLSLSDVLLLALSAQLISLSPFGRVGFREAAVAFVASRLSGGPGVDVESVFAQLALVDSAGEVLVIVPLGVLALPWLFAGLKRAKTGGAGVAGER
ncbi:MAG: flippase-like domain-containing protein [Phycisphaerales bacterium]|nr:flippase-like domain-containing protein [Phycisphaerales bacterium]